MFTNGPNRDRRERIRRDEEQEERYQRASARRRRQSAILDAKKKWKERKPANSEDEGDKPGLLTRIRNRVSSRSRTRQPSEQGVLPGTAAGNAPGSRPSSVKESDEKSDKNSDEEFDDEIDDAHETLPSKARSRRKLHSISKPENRNENPFLTDAERTQSPEKYSSEEDDDELRDGSKAAKIRQNLTSDEYEYHSTK